MSILHVPGARLYYEVRGDGPLLVLIPGAPGNARVFTALADQLAQRYTVLTYDRRGFSRSVLDGAQVANTVGRPVLELPGGHIGYGAEPVEFARELLAALN
ncbi:hypothetical protein GCM10009676_36270 [Prauserella halophila]|uniref:AB hydrolase-1 domain-containing protein n=1 Tax=Prauserella halophila TaxID=185641 RepID=A0ABN1WH80_9PSEU|nr:alpha/beta fold hydrolase [Prauserella halophila]MCP2238264.1 alpha/beta hydrolase fold [Prauserella halophila]